MHFIFIFKNYRRYCACGNEIMYPSSTLASSFCQQYKCPGNAGEYCGGDNAIEIYDTEQPCT